MEQHTQVAAPVPAKKYKPSWRKWHEAGFTTELMPIIPIDATLWEGSTVPPTNRGKVPGKLRQDGTWVGFGGKWVDEHHPDAKRLQRYERWGAGVGFQGRKFPGLDLDISVASVVEAIMKLAFDILGQAPVRYRSNSARVLLMYAMEGLPKHRLAFHIPGVDDTQAVEFIGNRLYWNADCLHPSAERYKWRNGHPFELKAEGITKITQEQVTKFYVAVVEYLDMMGYEIVKQTKTGSSNAERKSLDDVSLHAPSAQAVLDILAAVPCNDETFASRDDFVAALAAIKAALGPTRDEHWPAVLDWSLQYEGSTEEYVTKIWQSFREVAVGWNWLDAWARSHGYTGGAQLDFLGDGDQDPNARIPETPLEKMIARYVWVESLGRYYDTETGQLIAGREFNAANVAVATFGYSGIRTAEAEFLNAQNARKVACVTSRPGQALITTEANEYGVPVSAVNLWRPSNVKQNEHATDEDVAPWLDLVRKLFGKEDSPECKHFLDYLAYVLQNPGAKIGHALVIVGGQGVGKDSVLAPFFEAVGQHNVAPVDTATLDNQWTHFLKAQIIYVQEIHMKGRRGQYNHLKPLISGQKTRLQINEKGLRQYFVPNHQNWIITTNHNDAIALDDDDRRFWVHHVRIEEPPADAYFARFHAWLDAGGTENVYGWLLRRDVSNFCPMARPPMTTAKQTMLEQSQPAQVRFLRRLLTDDGPFSSRFVLTPGELLRRAAQHRNAPPGVEPHHALTALRAEDFKKGHRVRIGVETPQLWARGPSAVLDRNQMREQYRAEVAAEEFAADEPERGEAA